MIGISISFILFSNAILKNTISKFDKYKSLNHQIGSIKKPNEFYFIHKRLFDVLFSLISLLIFSPFFLLISIMIKVNDKGPIFYKMKRIGYKGKIFYCYKFRTMDYEHNYKSNELPLKNDRRITKVGRFLRSTNLDELPSLLSILTGNMSLVGRSRILDYDITSNKLTHKQIKLLINIKPGILNIWILSSNRFRFDFDSLYDFDLYYAKHRSSFFDLKILLGSFFVILGLSSGY